jgi:hypothetical protein
MNIGWRLGWRGVEPPLLHQARKTEPASADSAE